MVALESALQTRSGIYTVPEAAHYARIPVQTLRRWLETNKSGQRLLSETRLNDERCLSFHDFVQALAIRAIRSQHKVPLAMIYEAVQEAEQRHGVRYPLARKHTTWLFERQLVIRLEETGEYIELAGRGKGQQLLRIVEVYLRDLSFDADGLAAKYVPFPGILMDPQLRFGEPVVETCRIGAHTFWDATQAEGGFAAAAEAYGVEEEKVVTACRYVDLLEGRLAA